MPQQQRSNLLNQLAALALQEKRVLYLVGGVVRDLLCGEKAQDTDFDFLIDRDAIDFAIAAQKIFGGKLVCFPKFLTAKVTELTQFGQVSELDFATARDESYPTPGALPLVKPTTVKQDLCRRDFSINAMALPIEPYIKLVDGREDTIAKIKELVVDPCGGLSDLQQKTIRTLHAQSFIDDPTRLVRALRYVYRISGKLEHETAKQFVQAVDCAALETISTVRRFNELKKVLGERFAVEIFQELERCQALRQIIPLSDQARAELLSELVEKNDLFTGVIDQALKYELFLTLIASRLTTEIKTKLWRDLALAKKDIERIKRASTLSGVKPHVAVADSLDLIAYLLKAELEVNDIREELQRRKVLKVQP